MEGSCSVVGEWIRHRLTCGKPDVDQIVHRSSHDPSTGCPAEVSHGEAVRVAPLQDGDLVLGGREGAQLLGQGVRGGRQTPGAYTPIFTTGRTKTPENAVSWL